MTYSSNPLSYPEFLLNIIPEIMEDKAKITLKCKGDRRFMNRVRSQFYGLRRAYEVESNKLKDSDPTFSAELARRAERMLRYIALVEDNIGVVLMNKNIFYNNLVEVEVSEETAQDMQAVFIDMKYTKPDKEIVSVVHGRLDADIKNPFKPHSPDDPDSALNQPITQDDMEKLLMGDQNPQK